MRSPFVSFLLFGIALGVTLSGTTQASTSIFVSYADLLRARCQLIVAKEKLGPEKREVIRRYTDSFAGEELNRCLRRDWGHTCPPDWRNFADGLSEAIQSLPTYQGTVFKVNTEFPQEVFETFRPGTIYKNDGFTSSSTKLQRAIDPHEPEFSQFRKYVNSETDELAPGEDWQGVVIFEIESVSGKDIHLYSRFPAEREILIDRGASFEVLSVEWPDKFAPHVRMREIPAPGTNPAR